MADNRLEHFRQTYVNTGTAAFATIEDLVLGTDYHANGYTTRPQADLVADRLDLTGTQCLLDLGTGCGWPGIYLAVSMGCRAVLADALVEGLAPALDRARRDALADRVVAVAARAEALPFRAGSFDAICHADVIC